MSCRPGMIEVVLTDGTQCRMAAKALDMFLNRGRVRSFRRDSGWATVGVDPLRGEGVPHPYGGPDRRHRCHH